MSEPASDVFLQWKGTEVCLDFHCYACNTFAHFDGDFAYFLRCPTCGQHYEMPIVVSLKPVDKPDSACIQVPTEPELDLRDMGWEHAIPLGTCRFSSDESEGKS